MEQNFELNPTEQNTRIVPMAHNCLGKNYLERKIKFILWNIIRLEENTRIV